MGTFRESVDEDEEHRRTNDGVEMVALPSDAYDAGGYACHSCCNEQNQTCLNEAKWPQVQNSAVDA